MMAQKFYNLIGEGDKLSPKLREVRKKSLEGRKRVYIPEFRIHVFTKLNETEEQTRERYLSKTYKGINK